MEDGESDYHNEEMFPTPNMMESPSFIAFEELLEGSHTCTHAHTCNPPGPENSHTHTCYHVHTKLMPSASGEKILTDAIAASQGKKAPLGNKVAVRKLRAKKKAMVASLEEEVVSLRAMKELFLSALQRQALLEAEVSRLKCLLGDIRGRIEGAIDSFPYQNPTNTGGVYSNIMNSSYPGTYTVPTCNTGCTDQVYCLHPASGIENLGMVGDQGLNGCGFVSVQCLGSQDPGSNELPDCGYASREPGSYNGAASRGT